MEIYLSEEERVDELKKWWKANAKSVAVGIALGLAVMGSWNAWKNSQKNKAEEASGLYQQLNKAIEAKQTEPAIKLSERLSEQYRSTPYSDFAELYLAKLRADSGDIAGAKKVLQDFLSTRKDENQKHLARLRLGELMLASNESQAALKLLEPMTPKDMGKFESQYEELKGDCYSELHRPIDAAAAYEKAKQSGESTPMLELKIINLPQVESNPS